jgi:hypothetical protein
MPNVIKEYSYHGSVAIQDQGGKAHISSYLWSGKTRASSSQEAIRNLKYQYRKEYKLNTRIPLIMPVYNLREGDK